MSFFAVPPQYVGQTLRDIRRNHPDPWRSDLVASALGITEDTPLTSNMSGEVDLNPGSAEFQFFQKNFRETTREALYAEELIKTQQATIDEEKKFVDQYLATNPFAFDEALAKKAADAEYRPYYTELLDDYMVDLNRQRETTQDQSKLLQNLRQLDVNKDSRAYQYAVENAQKGWEGKGLFSSGMSARDIGRKEIEYKSGVKEDTARYETGMGDINRTLGAYDVAQEQKQRDIGRDIETAVTGGIEQRRGESFKQYYAPLVTAYSRRFPTSSGGVDQYLPPDYLRY